MPLRSNFSFFSTIFSIYLHLHESNYIFVKCACSIYSFLNSANLICRGTDISKYFRGSLGLRDNESQLCHFIPGVDAATIQRAAAGLPSNIYNTLAQVAGVTPAITPRVTPGFTPGYTPRPGFTPQVPGSGPGFGFRVSGSCNTFGNFLFMKNFYWDWGLLAETIW